MSPLQHRRSRAKRPRDDSSHVNTQNSHSAPQLSPYTPSYSESTLNYNSNQVGPSTTNSSFSPYQTQDPRNIHHSPRGKVAIPALRTAHVANPALANKKGRTTHACDFCRKAKAACTGGQPCVRCKNALVPCIYGDGKRDREKKILSESIQEANSLSKDKSDIVEALQKIRLDPSLSLEGMRAAIDEILSTSAAHPSIPTSKAGQNIDVGQSQFRRQFSARPEVHSGDELDSDIGSTGSLDAVNVDTDRDDTRATGHLGKTSAVAWAKRTAQECGSRRESEFRIGAFETGYALASYHTEDADIEVVDLTSVDAFDWPDYETANDLVGLYFDNVHNILPLLDRRSFYTKYESFARGTADLSSEDFVWLGSLNIVFAISAVHGQLSKRYGPHYHQQHLIYLKRATMLCLDRPLILEDARVSTCRMLGLLCLYFISTCRLNRAWTICGLAVRQATVLGLQIQSHAEDVDDYEKEQRVRLWWSLYCLECLLNELTGRPTCISDQDISATLPINMNEDDLLRFPFEFESIHVSENFSRRSSRASRASDNRPTATFQMPTGTHEPSVYKFPTLSLPPTTSTHFIYRIQLCIVSHEVITQLYCAATTKTKWIEVQDAIRRIDHRLLSWRDTLPPKFNIDFDKWTDPNWNDPHVMQRLGLAMTFNSSRMILYRPCLCRFEHRIESHSAKFNDFNQKGAEKCIHSARTMISLINWSAASVEKLYTITPWWNTLHYICEALSVLMLEMAFQAQHLPNEAAYILEDAKKGVLWLRTMAGESVSARKAWEIFDALVRLVAPMISWSVFDMPTVAPIPPGYNWRRFPAAGTSLPPRYAQHSQQTLQQGEQLNGANLQHLQFDVNQTGIDQNAAATSAWNTEQGQNFSFGTNEEFNFAPPRSQQGAGGEEVSNPLDHTTAVERFGSIGGLHGHYDEPWRHMFVSGLGGSQENQEASLGQAEFGAFGGNAGGSEEQGHQSQQTRFEF